MAISSICAAEGCDKAVYCRGWCGAHYWRWWAHGDPLAGRTPEGEPLAWMADVALTHVGEDCLQWPYARYSNGYGTVNQGGKMRSVTRVVCEAIHGPPPSPKHEAAHICGKGHEGCCNPKHLRWATPAENAADKLDHGTIANGEANGSAKLTEADVHAIRRRRATGEVLQAIAADYGVCISAISSIAIRKNWAWLE